MSTSLLCPWDFSRQEYWNELPFPSPGDLPDPGIEPTSPALQADSLPTELQGKLKWSISFKQKFFKKYNESQYNELYFYICNLHNIVPQLYFNLKKASSLEVQWLRLHHSTAGGKCLIPTQGTKIPHASRQGQKKKKKKKITEGSERAWEVPWMNK